MMEWVELGGGQVLVATEDRTWLHGATLVPSDPFLAAMTGEGSVATTGRLLDAAVGMSQRAALERPSTESLTLAGYVARLVDLYHSTRATTPLMRRVADRFAQLSRPDLAEFARHEAENEKDHDVLALKDLQALGYSRDVVEHLPIGDMTSRLLEYFHRVGSGAYPIEVFGYGYALERSSTAITIDFLRAIERLLPAGVKATRCLRLHSAIGLDVEHVTESVEAIATLPAPDRIAIVRAAYETARIMFVPGSLSRPETSIDVVTV